MRLHRDSTALLVVDIQSRLAPAMHQSESAIQANSALIRAARQLDIPVFASEHCAEKIGPTVADLRVLLKDDEILHKRHFSCADDAATYTAGFDKASYVSGDVAKLTVTFKDAKGNVANNVSAASALSVIAVPGMTLVSATGSATAVLKQGGKFEYTYTVGQIAGKYAAVVDFTGSSTNLATYAAVQNPSYSISTGGDSTTNADVLKSIVALIASINKQIQALQKLILKR